MERAAPAAARSALPQRALHVECLPPRLGRCGPPAGPLRPSMRVRSLQDSGRPEISRSHLISVAVDCIDLIQTKAGAGGGTFEKTVRLTSGRSNRPNV